MNAALRTLALLVLLPCALSAQTPTYLNPDAPLQARVSDLVSRMSLEEKISQMMDNAPAIQRLGVPEYGWWNEALHGVARAGVATVFPQAIGLAATWDDSLMLRTATVISDEARAKHHEYARQGKRLRYQGLTIFSPNINLFRDPRWGRGQETYGEDPFLTSRMGVQFVRGLQGDDPQYLKTVATVKHFAVHSGPEPLRHEFDAVVSERDLRETYLPHFEAGIREAGAFSLMCAYNSVFGKPACASDVLLQNILRGEWGFQGYVVSDCGAVDDIYERHKYLSSAPAAAALAVKTGTDLECGLAYQHLGEAVKLGLIDQAAIDTALTRLFTARFRLGMFDPPSRVKYAQIPYSIVDQPANRELARRVARESIVLLKNDANTLPLRKDIASIAVIGPNADDWHVLLGNYNGMPTDPVTPLRGIREAVGSRTKVLYARGADLAEGLATFEPIPGNALKKNGGLNVEYYANYNMTGAPLVTARDSTVNVNYREKAPRADMNPDDFSIRWTGVLTPKQTAVYRLGLNGSMKYALYLDDSLVVRSVYTFHDEFGDPRLRAGQPMTLQAGKHYRIRVEAQESYGEAQLQLMWGVSKPESLSEAVNVARKADAVVLFLGLSPRLEGEEMDVHIAGFNGGDRTSLDLPATQQQLLERVSALGKPTVLVLLSGSALAVNWAQQHVPAIVEAWYPGQAAGTAIADVLFGDYSPAGRLPVTFYHGVDELPAFDDYAMHDRTYRYFKGQPLYPFGHGLSYTSFGYSNLALSTHEIAARDTLTVSVDVQNTGARAGDEVAQLYVQHVGSKLTRPIKELKGYRRITLQPGEKQTVRFALPAAQLAYWDSTTHGWALEGDRVRVMVGASSADIRSSDTLTVKEALLQSAQKQSTLRLPLLFQNGMVLQRGQPIPVWGTAPAGAAVTVTLNGRTARATANQQGEWSAELPAAAAGGPYVLAVQSDSAQLRVSDVMIGDVWVASGQSNMEFPLVQANTGARAVAAAHDDALREFSVPNSYAWTPQSDLAGGHWAHADSANAGKFSAVAYFFARDLRAAEHVPVGIIHSSWGGSNIETWLSRDALGLSDAQWQTIVQTEKNYNAALRDSLIKRLGNLPTKDAGLVNGQALWADPHLDDAGWTPVPVPSLWESYGYAGMDGVGWYRTTFTLNDAEVKSGAQISLGTIDDNDITWLNGVEIGRTEGYAKRRMYTVPAGALQPGVNVLAIRVSDFGGGGGPYGNAAQFYVESAGTQHALAGTWKFKVGAVSMQGDGQHINKIPTILYNQMLHPLMRYPIRGVIWYQGESNANNDAQAVAYKPLFASLIQSWRREWNTATHDFPFLWVQLPNFTAPDTVPPVRNSWATLRESQNAALELPRTGQAVIIDLGDTADIHPRDKEPVGARLAKVARRVAYGEAVLASGPTYRSHTITGSTITIAFDHIGAGLVSHTGRNVSGFAIAGADQKWQWADARIVGSRVVVSSPRVPRPVAVRYAWMISPKAGLFNKEGWPATPFRTDSW